MTEHARDAEAIFLAALDKATPQERAAYVEATCGGDLELLERVRELLGCHEGARGPLDAPPPGLGGTVDPSVISERPGTVIGPYKLLQQIGEGGMGTVFMAEQSHPVRRKVALKIIKPGMDSRQVIARFEAERQALAMMDHPNIAKVLDAGTTESGRPYFVMELVKGVPVTRYCDEHHLNPRERLELFVPVCQAVQHAHQKGIIHRDLKPANVMVCIYDGQPVPKVIDFGVAKATGSKLTEQTLFTEFGAIVGTFEYMSPEQAQLDQLDIDTRSDIYSLGVLLYELLTGTTPLERKRMKEVAVLELLRLVREEESPRPSTRLSSTQELPSIAANRGTEPKKLSGMMRGELDWIVLKALDKDRNRRYETPNGLAQDIERYLNDEAVLACPPSASYRLRKLVRRNRAAVWTTGMVALALVAGAIVSAWQAVRATDARNATRHQLHLTQEAEDNATQRLYRSLVAQARASRLSRRMGQRFETLKTLTEATKMARSMNLPQADFLQLRNEVITCLALPDLRVAKEWVGLPNGSWRVDFAGTLERYARMDRQGGPVSIRRVADDAEIYRLPRMGPGDSWIMFSPDGEFLARSRGPHLDLWKLAGQAPVRLLEGQVATFAFSPDSRQFALALPDGSLSVYDLPSGRQVKKLGAGPHATSLDFNPKARQLAVCHAAGVQIRDLDTGSVLAELAQVTQPGINVAWHPNGKSLAAVGSDRNIYIWDVATRKQLARLEGHKGAGIACAFNHAGDLLASRCWDGLFRLWDPRTGQQLFQTQGCDECICFSPDDHLLAVGRDGNQLQLWEVGSRVGYHTFLAPGKRRCFNSAVHPDGRLLALARTDGTDFWDLPSGNHLASIKKSALSNWLLFESSRELLTNMPDGLHQWPVRPDPASAERLRIGPPQKLPMPGSYCAIASSRDGRVLASAQGDGGLVLHRDRPGQPIPLRPHGDVRYIAVSPDGRLVATGSHSGTKVKVWQALSGKLEKELPVETTRGVCFSPDGKWLATTGGGCRLWTVDGWKQSREVGGGNPFEFSPDSKLLAVETGRGEVRLVDPDSGQEFARLEDPSAARATSLSFTPDGSQLLTTSEDNSGHVWDLRAIRQELAKIDLDWEMLPYPPPPENKNLLPLQLQVDLGELNRSAPDPQEITRQVIEQQRRALDANPNEAQACNNLAWTYLTAPEALRDWKAALPLAQKAVQMDPSSTFRNTLGLAYYRAGRYREAVDTLEANLKEQVDWALAYDLYFLAMCYKKLGDSARARQFFDLAERWSISQQESREPNAAELPTFRVEASELLGIGKKKD
jgi:serine/threonine protein kinase/WD40 repeat protein